MLKKIFFAFTFKGAGAVSAYLSSILISQILGVENTGMYFLATSVIALLTVLATLGFNNAIVKECSTFNYLAEYCKLKNTFISALLYSIAAACFIMLLLLYISKNNSFFLIDDDLAIILARIAPALVLSVIVSLMSSYFQSKHQIIASIATLSINTHVVMILFTGVAAMYFDVTLIVIVYLYVAALLVNCMISAFKALKSLSFEEKFQFVSISGWKNFWITTISVSVLSHGVLIVSSPNLTLQELGLLGAAQRISLLVSFMLAAINLISTPMFSEIHSRNNREELKKLAQKTTLLMTLLAVPILVFVFVFSKEIMRLFGEDFALGYGLLWIVCAGQFFNVAFGSVAALLNMTGNSQDCKNLNLLMAIPFIVLTYFASRWYGANGAALSIALILIFRNFALYLFVLKRLKFSTVNLNFRSMLIR